MPLKLFASSLFHGVDYSLGQVSVLCWYNLVTGLFRCERLKGQQRWEWKRLRGMTVRLRGDLSPTFSAGRETDKHGSRRRLVK